MASQPHRLPDYLYEKEGDTLKSVLTDHELAVIRAQDRAKARQDRLHARRVRGIIIGSLALVSLTFVAKETGPTVLKDSGQAMHAAARSFKATQESQDEIIQHEQQTYGGHFKFPRVGAPHRDLYVGDIEFGIRMSNVSSMARVIHLLNKKISGSEAIDLINAEISQKQLDAGVMPQNVDPDLMDFGEAIMLPNGYNVGAETPAGIR